jgi:dipeptidyl aminopeptidase/acylaminoacyl peptidase
MIRKYLRILLVGLGLWANSRAASLIPVDRFFGLPAIRAPELSPDGSKIAFLFPKDGRLALGLFDRATGEARMILEGTDDNITGFFWKGNDRLVFGGDVNGSESSFIGVTDLTGKKILRLAESVRHTGGTFYGDTAGIVSELREDPENIIMEGIFVGNVDHAQFIAADATVERINLRTKARSQLLNLAPNNDLFFRQVLADNAGTVRLAERQREHEIVFQLRDDNKGSFADLARFPMNGYAETWGPPLVFAADNQTLYLKSYEENDRGAIYAYNTATRQRGPALFVPPEGEIAGIIMDYHRTKLQGVAYQTDRLHYHWFDQARGALQAKLENTFKGMECRIDSSSADELVHLVYVGSDRDAGTYYILDLKHPALTPFKRIRPNLDPAQMQPMQPVAFAARDGLQLHGYLTLPAGAGGKPVPLIVHPHGGPFGVRDDWGFNSEVQFLANRGYAVLQVNYRGSGGYGREFLEKGRYQWGRAMQDDLTDAVKWAITQGVADPKHVAIYGASYGGYAALAGVTLTPELYCCAVNYVGAADLTITFKNKGDDAFLTSRDFSYQREWIGKTDEYLEEKSPVNLVDRIRVPTLHAYGENDPRVKFDHWRRLEPQLKKFSKPYVAIVEENQGHGFRNESASIHFYSAMEKFLAENLTPHG